MRHIVAILLALFVAAGAARAEDNCTSEPTATLETPAGTFYLVNDPCQPECVFSIWVYQESNGVEGLQRCEDVYDDCCNNMYESDTLVL